MFEPRQTLMFFIYAVILFALLPIVQYEVYQATTLYDSRGSFFIWVRVFLSGPLLINFGALLLLIYKQWVHKLFAIIALVVAIYWLAVLYRELF
jgi:hypothetical protein